MRLVAPCQTAPEPHSRARPAEVSKFIGIETGGGMSFLKNAFEISHTNHKSIFSMEGIRGFAVFLVFVVHYVTLVEPWLDNVGITFVMAKQMRAMGNVGVDLFFVLSGYLIYGMLIKKERPFWRYVRRRIQRIYPTFSVVLVFYLILSAVLPSMSKIPVGWNGALYVLQNFLLLPGLFDIEAIITVAWSLSYEFFYYLAMPLLIAALRLRSWRPHSRALLFFAVSFIGFAWIAINGGHVRLLMFLSGVLLFEASENWGVKVAPGLGLFSLFVAIGVTISLAELDAVGWWKYATLYVLFFVFCLECFTGGGLAVKLFTFAPIRWLGNMSYSYYLIHGLTLKFLFLVLAAVYPPTQADVTLFWLLLPVFFALTLVPASLLFLMIEKPYSLAVKGASPLPAVARA